MTTTKTRSAGRTRTGPKAAHKAEMLRDAVTVWRAGVRKLRATDRGDLAAQRTELAAQAIQSALADVRELAEVITLAQSQAWDPIARRLRENAAELKKALRLR